MAHVPSDALGIFGATGDLAFKKIFPALHQMVKRGRLDAPVVATDISSGVNASTGEVEGMAVHADVTVTFHAPKFGHWIAPGKDHTGDLRVGRVAQEQIDAGVAEP